MPSLYNVGAYDIVGGLDIVGEDDDADLSALLAAASGMDIVGAAPGGSLKSGALGPGQLALRTAAPTKAREFPIGFVSTGTVAAAAQATVTNRPQVIFRPVRLLIPSDIAGSFTLDDIIIGKNSQFVAVGSVPGRTFQEDATAIALGLDTAQVSQDISLRVTNISGGALTFRATMIGRVVE